LAHRGYRVIGPIVREGAIIYDTVAVLDDLPIGWTDQQNAGRYRLQRRADMALFGYAVGPHSWKRFLHPPVERLWQARREGDGFAVIENEEAAEPLAFIGVRACELRAIAIQDRVFLAGEYLDKSYKIRRDQAFIVAVNCGQAGGTCFCASMDAGPKVDAGFDLALTELIEEGRHVFLVEVGSAAGMDLVKGLPHRAATEEEIATAERVVARTKGQMGRTLNTEGLKELLQANPSHPRWDEVADRCLACGNCTMVCPTCFCATVDDATDLSGTTAERVRRWDSCFTLDFSYLHGGNVRNSTRSRYRQWMTHKLAHWFDQFGTSGCVGCGRCITWCPVGIDITEEAAAIRAVPNPSRSDADGRS
jgi:sulfhydrogenase subunit beta (sulfur reductase)